MLNRALEGSLARRETKNVPRTPSSEAGRRRAWCSTPEWLDRCHSGRWAPTRAPGNSGKPPRRRETKTGREQPSGGRGARRRNGWTAATQGGGPQGAPGNSGKPPRGREAKRAENNPRAGVVVDAGIAGWLPLREGNPRARRETKRAENNPRASVVLDPGMAGPLPLREVGPKARPATPGTPADSATTGALFPSFAGEHPRRAESFNRMFAPTSEFLSFPTLPNIAPKRVHSRCRGERPPAGSRSRHAI